MIIFYAAFILQFVLLLSALFEMEMVHAVRWADEEQARDDDGLDETGLFLRDWAEAQI
jgi:hypothetical protein